MFGAAWDIVATRCPEYLPTLTFALSAVVPVVGEPAGFSARDAFGSVAIAPPGDAETLFLLLLRETQTYGWLEMTRDDLIADLHALGLRTGWTVLVHASMRRIGRVAGGTKALVDALSEALGPASR
jgi:hypothetical protein